MHFKALWTEYSQGEENLGMAMTFTLVSHLRERLSDLVRTRAEDIVAQEREKERLAIEVRAHMHIPISH